MKTPYSVWRKMQRKNVTFEQLSDIMAFRVVVGSLGDCYHALGLLHSRYPVVPGRFKDYISTPKPNGYRSLHSTIIGPERHRIEVQIRTHDMHEVAEYGVAAHWKYKQNNPQVEGRQYRWMRELLDILEHADNPEEFLEHTKLEMFQDQVFCFTPKGAVIALPSGATPVDFAYAVHSEVGDTCVGAKVNGRMVQLRAPLQNGDQVEIITSKAQTPSPDWEQFVVSGKAKARVRRFVRLKQREQYIELGRQILQKSFRQEGYDMTDKGLESVLKRFKCDNVGDLCASVGQGHFTGREVVTAVFPGTKVDAKVQKIVPIARARARQGKGRETSVPIKGLIPGMAVHYAHCCHPLPGDRIVGIVTTGKGVTVHTIDCDTLESFQATPERWVDLSWDVDEGLDQRIGRLHVVVANEPGSLGSLSTIIGKNHGNISNLKITNRSIDFFEMLIDVEVTSVKHLSNIIAALRAMPVITSVERARG
jgi:GTP pyrophosphokinase